MEIDSNDVQGTISASIDLYRIFTHKDQTAKFRIIVGEQEEQQKDAQKKPAK